LHKQVAVI